ncbi:2565_t:CDS:2, partial [Racocetra persica]
FLQLVLPEHITTFSVVYHAMNEEHWIEKENLKQILHKAILIVITSCLPGSKKYEKLQNLLSKSFFCTSSTIALEGVCSLRDFEVAKEPDDEKIEFNLRILKGNLKNSKARYAELLRKSLKNFKSTELSWCNPPANQIL